jgi:hypothetical protein
MRLTGVAIGVSSAAEHATQREEHRPDVDPELGRGRHPDRDHDQRGPGLAEQLAEDRRHHEQARQQPIRSHVAADVDEGLGDEVGRTRLEQQRDAGEGELGRAVGLRQGVCPRDGRR